MREKYIMPTSSSNYPKRPLTPRFSMPPPPKNSAKTQTSTQIYPPISIPTPSLGRTLMEGMAFGTGSAVARKTVDAFMQPSIQEKKDIEISSSSQTQLCEFWSKTLEECLTKEQPYCDKVLEQVASSCSSRV